MIDMDIYRCFKIDKLAATDVLVTVSSNAVIMNSFYFLTFVLSNLPVVNNIVMLVVCMYARAEQLIELFVSLFFISIEFTSKMAGGKLHIDTCVLFINPKFPYASKPSHFWKSHLKS